MNFNFNTLQIERYSKYILIVTLSRSHVRNAINSDMITDLNRLWTELSHESNELRCVIVTGEDNAFCAGADLKERKNMTLDVWKNQVSQLRQSMLMMRNCSIPIMAAVNGAAFGGGLELVLASDFAYAATTATFAQSEVKIGIIPGALGTQHLPKACGIRRAKELIFTADSFSAQDAYAWGIVNKICEPEELMREVLITATKIVENAPLAIREAKKAVNVALECDVITGFKQEFDHYQCVLETKDRIEGINAFNEKRKPVYKGE